MGWAPLGRVGQYVLVLLLAVTVNFALPRTLPGGPLAALGGDDVGFLAPEARAALLATYGLDRPLPEQFGSYLVGLLQGDLGTSLVDQRPVTAVLAERAGPTLLLVGTALLLTSVLGIALGTLAAAVRQRRRDTAGLALMITLDSLPPFWVGMLLIFSFGVTLKLLPTFGITSPAGGGGVADVAAHLVLPVATLVLTRLGHTYLVVRSSMLSVLGSEHLAFARAQGVGRSRLLVHHGLRGAALPVSTLVLLELGWLIDGDVVVETVFSYPGLGRLLYEAVLQRDYPVMQGVFLVLTVAVVGMNLLAELCYPLLDPRLRRPAAVPAG